MTNQKKEICGGTIENAKVKLQFIHSKIKELAQQSGKETKLLQLEKEYNKILQNDLIVNQKQYITWKEIVNKQ